MYTMVSSELDVSVLAILGDEFAVLTNRTPVALKFNYVETYCGIRHNKSSGV